MRRYLAYGITTAMVVLVALSFMADADEIKKPDIPIILVDCEGVTIEYGDIDTCWPGEIISVPVLISNEDSLDKIELWGLCTGDVSYDDIDATGTPWTGSIIDTSAGTTIEVHFVSGILDTSTIARRLIDVELQVSSSAAFGSTHGLGFDHVVQVSEVGNPIDCDVPSIDLDSSIIIIPDDSVAIILDWETAYSYQAADVAGDRTKDDFPAIIPLYLYTNFPCSTYSLIFFAGSWGDVIDFESKGGGSVCTTLVHDFFKISGRPTTKPGNDSTIYLGDIKMKIADYESSYNSNCAFSDTFYVGFRGVAWGGRKSYVYNWGGADSVGYADINADTGGVILPPYEVELEVKDADVQIDSTVDVPVTITPTFYSQYYQLFIQYDTTYLSYTGFTDAGGTIPPVTGAIQLDTIGVQAFVEFHSNTAPVGKYTLPDIEQTLFTMHFTAKDAFDPEETTDIKIDGGVNWKSRIYDWFSSDGSKITVDDEDTGCWTAVDGTVTHPVLFCIEPDSSITCYSNGTIAKIPIKLTYLNENCGDSSVLFYTWSTYADSITNGDVSLTWENGVSPKSGIYSQKIDFNGTFSNPGTYAYVWVSDSAGLDGDSFEILSISWIEYNSGTDRVYITPGDPIEVNCLDIGPKLEVVEELPFAYSLDENYPNPFNAKTKISFSLAEPGYTEIEIFDILGRRIKLLLSEYSEAGNRSVIWDGTNQAGKQVAGGVYFYVLRSNEFEDSKKMLYLK